jgi:excisionase family DNA binding protein
MNEELLTVEELADLLKVPATWIYQRTRCRSSERLPHIKIGKYLRFEEGAVLEWLGRHRRDYQNLSAEG